MKKKDVQQVKELYNDHRNRVQQILYPVSQIAHANPIKPTGGGGIVESPQIKQPSHITNPQRRTLEKRGKEIWRKKGQQESSK